MTKVQIALIDSLVLGYGLMIYKEYQDKRDTQWYRMAKEISKTFNKQRFRYTEQEKVKISKGLKHLSNLDATYFEDKKFSPFICIIKLVEYMIREQEDWFYKGKLAHWDLDLLNQELRVVELEVNIDTDRFTREVLNYVEGLK